MKKASTSEIARGQTISFRIPSDTPDHLLKELQRLKETERRNFSSKIAEFVMDGVNHSHTRERETVTIPLAQRLSKAQRDWLKHEHSEALLGSIFYQLISDPVRTTSLLASLNSNSVDIDEALYLQEDMLSVRSFAEHHENGQRGKLAASPSDYDLDGFEDDDLSEFNWENAKKQEEHDKEENIVEEMDVDDLLGGFLDSMNK